MGDFPNAIDDLTTAIGLVGDHQIALTYRGYTLLALQDYPNALRDLTRVECNTSEHYQIAYYRGNLHEQLQHWQFAIDDYLLAYNLNSMETGAGIKLARLQAGCPSPKFRNGHKAVENAINMCVRSHWADWIATSVLGAAYSETGDFDNALKYARIAFDLAPDNEKPERRKRIAQFEDRIPFRMGETDALTGLPVTEIAT